MYDMGRARRQGLGDTISYEQRMNTLDEVGKQRTREAGGEPRRDIRALPESADKNTPEIVREFLDYYDTSQRTPPQLHESLLFHKSRTDDKFLRVRADRDNLAPAAPDDRRRACCIGLLQRGSVQQAAEPKELFVVPGASHVDLYDRPEYVAQSLKKLDSFFRQYLNEEGMTK